MELSPFKIDGFAIAEPFHARSGRPEQRIMNNAFGKNRNKAFIF